MNRFSTLIVIIGLLAALLPLACGGATEPSPSPPATSPEGSQAEDGAVSGCLWDESCQDACSYMRPGYPTAYSCVPEGWEARCVAFIPEGAKAACAPEWCCK